MAGYFSSSHSFDWKAEVPQVKTNCIQVINAVHITCIIKGRCSGNLFLIKNIVINIVSLTIYDTIL